MPSENRPRVAVAALIVSAATLVGIAANEGYTNDAIIPVKGDVPTYGFGETRGVRMGDTTTPVRALIRLENSADGYAEGMRSCIDVPLYQREFDAYLDFTYNVGTYAFCHSTLNRRLNARDYAGACHELLRWNRQGGRVLPGLTVRRQCLFALCPITEGHDFLQQAPGFPFTDHMYA